MVIPQKHNTLKHEYMQPPKPPENLLGLNPSGTGHQPKVPSFKQMNLQLKLKKEPPTCHSYREEEQTSHEPEAGTRFVTTEYLKRPLPRAVNMVSQTLEANISTESDQLLQAEEVIAHLRHENSVLRQNQELQQKVKFCLSLEDNRT